VSPASAHVGFVADRVTRRPFESTGSVIWATFACRLILRHILPNVLAPVILQLTLSFSTAILAEATLSSLGLGTQPPEPSWGTMLASGRKYMELAPWLTVFPGFAIMLAVLGFNRLGDSLRDALNPRFQGK